MIYNAFKRSRKEVGIYKIIIFFVGRTWSVVEGKIFFVSMGCGVEEHLPF